MEEKKYLRDDIEEAKKNGWDENLRFNYRCNTGGHAEELMVTITLAEYRHLVSDLAATKKGNSFLITALAGKTADDAAKMPF